MYSGTQITNVIGNNSLVDASIAKRSTRIEGYMEVIDFDRHNPKDIHYIR